MVISLEEEEEEAEEVVVVVVVAVLDLVAWGVSVVAIVDVRFNGCKNFTISVVKQTGIPNEQQAAF